MSHSWNNLYLRKDLNLDENDEIIKRIKFPALDRICETIINLKEKENMVIDWDDIAKLLVENKLSSIPGTEHLCNRVTGQTKNLVEISYLKVCELDGYIIVADNQKVFDHSNSIDLSFHTGSDGWIPEFAAAIKNCNLSFTPNPNELDEEDGDNEEYTQSDMSIAYQLLDVIEAAVPTKQIINIPSEQLINVVVDYLKKEESKYYRLISLLKRKD